MLIGLLRLQCADDVFYCSCDLVMRERESRVAECVRDGVRMVVGGWRREENGRE